MHKNSIFVRLLVAATSVMLLQVLLIGVVLFANGTVTSLEDNAAIALLRNAENRHISLENQMVYSWSNLGTLESEISAAISGYIAANGIDTADAFGSYEHENGMLYDISDALISALRHTESTGVFLFFVGEDVPLDAPASLRGLYYRDMDIAMTPSNNSDILLEKGQARIARKHNIQLDSSWTERYDIAPHSVEAWNALFVPLQAAKEQPSLAVADLSYWSAPHHLNPGSKIDANECITYTRPLRYGGQLIGVVGTEVLVDHLDKYFPAREIGGGGLGGYMLLHGDDASGTQYRVYASTGSYADRIAGADRTVSLKPTARESIFSLQGPAQQRASVAVTQMRLYNSNAPFSGEQWSVAAVAADEELFELADRLKNGILFSALLALMAGVVLMYLSIRLSTRPLLQLAEQIRSGGPNDPVTVPGSNAYEIELLSDTINDMKQKRQHMEGALMEERERYMIALESATSTFVEYDVQVDRFMVYSFTEQDGKPTIASNIVQQFSARLLGDMVCHEADRELLRAVIGGNHPAPCELRLHPDLFPHLKDEPMDDGFHWFELKLTAIRSDWGVVVKTIGSARLITNVKLQALAVAESKRRDITTGLYNREYGELMLSRRAYAAGCFACSVGFDGFDRIIAAYGRVYAAVILREAARVMSGAFGDQNLMIRWADDEFLVLAEGLTRDEVEDIMARVLEKVNALYMGDDLNQRMTAGAGIAVRARGENVAAMISYARGAMRRAAALGTVQFGGDADAPRPPSAKRIECVADISSEAAVGFAFSLFEHTTDVESVINMLLRVLGELFGLRQIVLFSFDQDFGASQAQYQWCAHGVPPCDWRVSKSTHEDFAALQSLLDEAGALRFTSAQAARYPDGVRALLSWDIAGGYSALYCAMIENGVHTGRVVYVAPDEHREWSPADVHSLHEIAKIISTQISLAKTNAASRAKSEFLSRMSHEIRTPMNAIIGMSNIAKNAMQSDPVRLKDSLDKIDLSAKHLLALINDVLDMSRIESGKMSIDRSPFSLTELGRDLDTLMNQQLEDKGISFRVGVRVQDPSVVGDEQKLRQVLINLLSNAAKFTPQGGTVTLDIEQHGAPVDDMAAYRFSVKDTGVGIVKEDQIKIFNAFEQSEASNESAGRPQGTGLGLAISSSLIHAMGGRIELASEVGHGSEFFFSLKLPLGQCGEQDVIATERRPAEYYRGYFRGKRVLIVEDNAINLEIATYIVETAGFDVETACDGQEGVDRFLNAEPGHFDVIFMDISMPVMDGLTATRMIRKNSARPDARTIPIIAMTANAFGEDTKKSIDSGMNGHIAKPIDVQALYALLDALLMRNDTE